MRRDFNGTLFCSRKLTKEEAEKVNEILGRQKTACEGSEEIAFTNYIDRTGDIYFPQKIVDYLTDEGINVAGELEFDSPFDCGKLSVADGSVTTKRFCLKLLPAKSCKRSLPTGRHSGRNKRAFNIGTLSVAEICGKTSLLKNCRRNLSTGRHSGRRNKQVK